jgi:alpha-ketoglutarate-dependent taurine dioxygenase
MLTTVVKDRRAWRRDTVDPPARWRQALSTPFVAALNKQAAEGLLGGQPITDLQASPRLRTDFGPELAGARQELETGRGFVILRADASDRPTPQHATAIYWLVGQLLGKPFVQNVQGTLLYDVRDTGQDVRYGARFSVTNAESTFHTDNSFGKEVLDYVGLLCVNAARSGGRSQMVSAFAVHNQLLERHPEALAQLYRPYEVDRRGGVLPGEPPTIPAPVLAHDRGGLLCRYLRYWIEVGQEKAGQPLAGEPKRALDVLDEVMADPEMQVEFDLRPGDMYFINNRWLLHNRTAYEDHDEPERKRHLVRLWLQATA